MGNSRPRASGVAMSCGSRARVERPEKFSYFYLASYSECQPHILPLSQHWPRIWRSPHRGIEKTQRIREFPDKNKTTRLVLASEPAHLDGRITVNPLRTSESNPQRHPRVRPEAIRWKGATLDRQIYPIMGHARQGTQSGVRDRLRREGNGFTDGIAGLFYNTD